MMWGDTMSLQLIFFSLHHVICNVEGEGNRGGQFCSSVYGWRKTEDQHRTWGLIDQIQRNAQGP